MFKEAFNWVTISLPSSAWSQSDLWESDEAAEAHICCLSVCTMGQTPQTQDPTFAHFWRGWQTDLSVIRASVDGSGRQNKYLCTGNVMWHHQDTIRVIFSVLTKLLQSLKIAFTGSAGLNITSLLTFMSSKRCAATLMVATARATVCCSAAWGFTA